MGADSRNHQFATGWYADHIRGSVPGRDPLIGASAGSAARNGGVRGHARSVQPPEEREVCAVQGRHSHNLRDRGLGFGV